MPLILAPDDVKRATDIGQMIDVIETGIREQAAGDVDLPARQNLRTSNGFFRVMPCVMRAGGKMGIKIFNGSVEHGVRYIILIYDERGGELLCLMDAAYLTGARTGATTGIATRYQARADAHSVGVIGSGLEARTNFAAVCAVRNITSATVFSPNPANRARFATELGKLHDVDIRAAESAQDAVRGQDIVIVATNTTGHSDNIAYRGAWMESGQHINSIGATGGHLREIDPQAFANAERILVDTYIGVKEESGDSIAALAAGTWDDSRIIELPQVLDGATARDSDAQITLFKSVGSGVQDVMAGFAVYEQAQRLGLGSNIPDFLEHKIF
jgi:alanine dehydrogenase